MKSIIHYFLFNICVAAALGQGNVQVVVPGSLATVEGNSSVNDFLNSSSFRMQMVFDASQFSSLGNNPTLSNRVDAIQFRNDGASSADMQHYFAGGSVTLSTTTRTPDSLSPVFADNVGPDAVTILNNPLVFGAAYQPGVNPQPFYGLPATAPFYYDPSKGNLLVDIRSVEGLVLFPGSLDAQNTSGDSVSRVFAIGNLSATGTPDSLGLVTRFSITQVPEPASWLLLIIGIGLAGRFIRR